MYTTEFQVEEFLTEYKRSRVIAETSVRAILRRAIEWENKFGKAFYNYNKEEALEMFKSAHAISVVSLQNSNLTLKHAARYFQNKVGDNVYEEIGKYDLEECVDKDKKSSLILSREDLEEIQSQLLNWTDRGILLMLFLGAGAKWLKEITFFDLSQADKQCGIVYFRTGKTIRITPDEYEIIKNACEETELASFGSTARISKVQSEGFFKLRCNVLSASDDMHDERSLERRFRFIQRRLYLISNDLGITLTSGGIQDSGLLYYLKQGITNSGLTFREYVKTEEAKNLARQYDIMSELYSQILVDKFEKFFNN